MKKICMFLLIGSLFALSGCGKEPPTAQMLVDQAFVGKDTSAMDVNMNIAIDISSDMIDANGDLSISTKMNSNVHMVYDKDTSYVSGKVSAQIMDVDTKMSILEYAQYFGDEKISYTYDEKKEDWYVEKEEGTLDTFQFDTFSSEMFQNLVLEMPEDDEDHYLVTATTTGNALSTILGDNSFDVSEASSDATVNVRMIFEKATQKLESLSFEIPPGNIGGVDYNQYVVSLEFLKFGPDAEVIIPEYIVATAKDKSQELMEQGYSFAE